MKDIGVKLFIAGVEQLHNTVVTELGFS